MSAQLKNSIGYVSTGYLTLQQQQIMKTINGSFQSRAKVAVVTCYLFDSFFHHHIHRSQIKQNIIRHSDHLVFYDWTDYLEKANVHTLAELLQSHDCILWDLPGIEVLERYENQMKAFLPLIGKLKVLSVNNRNLSDIAFESQIRSYFEEHGFPLDPPVEETSRISKFYSFIKSCLR